MHLSNFKKYFKDIISYKLNAIADMLNIELEHHRALSDARACAEIAIHIFKNENINSFDLIEDNFNLKLVNYLKVDTSHQ